MFKLKNFVNIILKIANEIKDFLLKPKSKEFFLYLFFCGLATIFWFMLALNDTHKETLSVPIRLSGVPSDVMITNVPDSILRLGIEAKGTTILDIKMKKYLNTKKVVELRFDSLKVISQGSEIKLATSYLQRILHSMYKGNVDIDIISPDTLEYIYAKSAAKRVPIQFIGTLETSPQYFILDTVFTPDSIDVYAPSSILKDIKKVDTRPINVENIMESQSFQVRLLGQKGVKLMPNSVEFKILTDVITEKTVTVPLVGTGFPIDQSLLTFPSEVQITFQVGAKLFSEVSADDFAIELPYSELIKQEGNYPLRVTKYPSEVKRMRLSHRSVDFLIEKTTSKSKAHD